VETLVTCVKADEIQATKLNIDQGLPVQSKLYRSSQTMFVTITFLLQDASFTNFDMVTCTVGKMTM